MPEPTTGTLINTMLAIRNKRSELAKEVKHLGDEFAELEATLLKRLADDDSIQAKSKQATATVSELVIPTIEDWEEFERWVIDNDALYMLEKRPSGGAFRELIQRGDSVPGLKPFNKTTISLRTA